MARLQMDVDLGGLEERRRLTVHRDDEGEASERVLIRFNAPPDLRNLGLLYFEQADRPNDYFLYRPAVRRVRRMQEDSVKDNLYGIDPEFLGFGIAQSEPTEVESMKEVRVHGREAFRLSETAKERNRRFDERDVWIDKKTFIPLRTEHRLDGRTVLIAETLKIEEIQGIPTPIEMRFERPLDDTRVRLEVIRVDYRAKISRKIFSIFHLTKSQHHVD